MLNRLLITLNIVFLVSASTFAQTNEWHLAWDKNQEDDMAYYKVYRSTSSPAYTEHTTVEHPTNGDETVTLLD